MYVLYSTNELLLSTKKVLDSKDYLFNPETVFLNLTKRSLWKKKLTEKQTRFMNQL